MNDTAEDLTPIAPELLEETGDLPGVIRVLGELGPGAVVTEGGMARLFQRHPASVRRAVRRGELPPPMRLFGSVAWTVGSLTRFFEARLAEAEKEAIRTAQSITRLSP